MDYQEELLKMVENGEIDKDLVIMACVKFMGPDDVEEMMKQNEFIIPAAEEEEDEEDEMERENREADESKDMKRCANQ